MPVYLRNFYYKNSDPIKSKIETIAMEIYRADGVDYNEEAEKSIKILESFCDSSTIQNWI